MQIFFFLNSNSFSAREKKTGDAYELIITSMNTVANLSSPLVTRLASSIQLGRRERERGTSHDALSLQQSRAGGECWVGCH